ncbi:MAG: 30S ribosomal protein S8 [Candidatus Moranbacteria bacterium]|nr:30S ribosomal protein S8 [Candidatus Moranbacteria bacterium]
MDNIANMFSKIKNAQQKNQKIVFVPFSNIKLEILKILEKSNYISKVNVKEKDKKRYIGFELLYLNNKPKLTQLKRISKPGCRIYKGYREIYPVLDGVGLALISTSKGVMTNYQARKQKLGGEIICEIY